MAFSFAVCPTLRAAHGPLGPVRRENASGPDQQSWGVPFRDFAADEPAVSRFSTKRNYTPNRPGPKERIFWAVGGCKSVTGTSLKSAGYAAGRDNAILGCKYGTEALHHSSSGGCEIVEKYSSVGGSPSPRPLVANSRRSRRIILPLRVLGRASAKRMSFGRAIDPTWWTTCFFNSSLSSSPACEPPLSVTNAAIASPVMSSGKPTTAASATLE